MLRDNKWSHAASVADQIAARIAGLITLDLIHAGHRLLEKDISEVLHVSRAPVREALRILDRAADRVPAATACPSTASRCRRFALYLCSA